MLVTEHPSTIWRFDLPVKALETDVELTLRNGAQLLTVDRSARTNVAALWFLVPMARMADTGEQGRVRNFRAFGTGHLIPAGYHYLGSTGEGHLVWHIFERTDA